MFCDNCDDDERFDPPPPAPLGFCWNAKGSQPFLDLFPVVSLPAVVIDSVPEFLDFVYFRFGAFSRSTTSLDLFCPIHSIAGEFKKPTIRSSYLSLAACACQGFVALPAGRRRRQGWARRAVRRKIFCAGRWQPAFGWWFSAFRFLCFLAVLVLLGPPVVPFYRFFFGGGFPYQNRLPRKVGTLILTSLLEDLV